MKIISIAFVTLCVLQFVFCVPQYNKYRNQGRYPNRYNRKQFSYNQGYQSNRNNYYNNRRPSQSKTSSSSSANKNDQSQGRLFFNAIPGLSNIFPTFPSLTSLFGGGGDSAINNPIRYRPQYDPCFRNNRNQLGRTFPRVNVYNVYPGPGGISDGFGGGGGCGLGLADPPISSGQGTVSNPSSNFNSGLFSIFSVFNKPPFENRPGSALGPTNILEGTGPGTTGLASLVEPTNVDDIFDPVVDERPVTENILEDPAQKLYRRRYRVNNNRNYRKESKRTQNIAHNTNRFVNSLNRNLNSFLGQWL